MFISQFGAQRLDAQFSSLWPTQSDAPSLPGAALDEQRGLGGLFGSAEGFGSALAAFDRGPAFGAGFEALRPGLLAPAPAPAPSPAPAAAPAPAPAAGGGVFGLLAGPAWVAGPTLPGALDNSVMGPVAQGNSKACGTSSLSMILDYFGINVPREQIDREIRRTDNGLPPQPLIDYARSHGLQAEFYNNGSWDEMKGLVGRGVAVQAQINTKADGASSNMHWVAVVGFRTDPATGREQIGFRDSGAKGNGEVRWMDRAEFEKQWARPLDGTAYNNSFIAYARPGTDLPPARWGGVEALTSMLTGASNVANNWDRIFSPDDFGDFVHGLHALPGSVVQTAGGAIGFGIQTAGQWIDGKLGDIPVLGWVARPFGQIVSGFGAGIGNLFGGIGDSFNAAGGAFGKLFRGDVGGFFGGLADAGGKLIGGAVGFVGGIAGGFADAAGSAVKTVGDGVKAVGNAIEDGAKAVGKFFKGLF